MNIFNKPKDISNTSFVIKVIVQLLFLFVMIEFSYSEFDKDGNFKFLLLRSFMSFMTSIIIVHYAWLIGNTLRFWITPRVIITSGALDAYKQKIFWLYGPQFISACIFSFIFFGGFNFLFESYINPSISNSLQNSSTLVQTPAEPLNNIKVPLQNDTDLINSITSVNNNTSNIKELEQIEEKKTIQELEKKAQYTGDDPVIRNRLGLPPKN